MLTEISTAFYRGDEVVLCGPNGEREVVQSEYASFFRKADVTERLHRDLERSDKVRSTVFEGDWLRVRWTDYGTRESAIKFFHDNGVKSFEGDVSPIKRVLADRDIRIARPRLAFLDIETDSRLKFAQKKEMRVLCWTVVREDGKYRQGLLEQDTDAAEIALLEELSRTLKDFDVVAAWNGGVRKDEGFDFTVLDARAKMFGVRWKPQRVLTVDAMVLWEKMNRMAAESGEEKASLALDSIGQAVLNVGKIKTPDWVTKRFGNKSLGALTWPMWEAGGEARVLMAHYCWHDTELMRRLFEKKGFFQVFFGLCQVTNCLPESRSMQTTQQMDGYLLRYGAKAGVHWPTKVYGQGAPAEKFKGAFVMEPSARGVERNVHVVDFKSLYPSIMISWNMSPETIVGPDFDGPVAVTPNGVRFRTDVKGILSGALEALLAGREQFKNAKKKATPGTSEWYDADARSNGYKVAANSCYGGVGSPFTRFYKPQIAEAVTQTGAWLIQTGIIFEAEKIGMRPVFGDSVTGDRVIIVRDPGGNVQMLTAAELWDVATSRGNRGSKQVATLDGWNALARGEDGDGFFPISAIVRHRSGKATWRITTKHGQAHVTTDHGIISGGEKVTPMQFAEEGLRFDVVEPHEPRAISVIDLMEFIGGYESASGEKFECDDEWIWVASRKSKHSLVRVRRYYREGTSEWSALFRLLTAYVSDGSASLKDVTASRYMLSFCKSDRALQSELANDLHTIAPDCRVFGPYWTETVYVVRSGTHTLAALFATLCGFKSRGKKLPSFFFELSEETRSLVVEYLVKGDGYVDGSGGISFTSNSAKLISGVSYLFSQHGMLVSNSFRPSKRAWTIRSPRRQSKRYTMNVEIFEPRDDEWVYDLTVEGAHTFVDGVGRVLLHNTDSCAMQGISVERCSAFVKWCNEEKLPEMVKACGVKDNRISIAYEKAFKVLICAADRDGKSIAKTYCGSFLHYEGKEATADSKPEVKGLEYKRGDAIRLAREMQEELIELLLVRECFDVVEIERFISGWRKRILEGDLELDDIMRSQALKHDLSEYEVKKKVDGTDAAGAAHVAVARLLAERGEDVSQGTKIEYVVVDGDASPQKVVPISDFDGTFDRRYLWNSGVWPASARVLRGALPDVDWDVWLAIKPRASHARPVPEEQGKLILFPDGEMRVPRTRRVKEGEVLVRFSAARGNLFSKIVAACEKSPGNRPLVVELETDKATTAVLDFGQRILVDLTPSLDRALREIGCEILEAKT